MSIHEISLQDCPADLRGATEKRMAEQHEPWELLSVTVHNSTPYIDKSKTLTCHQAILCKDNTFLVLDAMGEGIFYSLSESMFTLGTLIRVVKTAPEWMGLTAAAASISG